MIAAVVQMTSTDDVAANLERASRGIERAVAGGAELVALPENFAFMREEGGGPNPAAQPIDGEAIAFLREHARRHGVVIAGGTIPEEIAGDDRVHNTSVVIDAAGAVASTVTIEPGGTLTVEAGADLTMTTITSSAMAPRMAPPAMSRRRA